MVVGGALVATLLAIAATQLLPGPVRTGPAAPGSRTAAGILVPSVATPTNVAFGRSLGRSDAPVHLTVWSDFQCAACKEFSETSELRLIADYVVAGKLRIDYRDLVTVGPESSAAAGAARCADDQGRFWPYHDVLFANQMPENTGQLGPRRLKDMADAIGLDRLRFDACLPSIDVFSLVQAESRIGQSRGSAPPLLDFGQIVIETSPAYEQLQQTVDALLAQAPSASASGRASGLPGSSVAAPTSASAGAGASGVPSGAIASP